MPDIQVEVPGVGVVSFPDTMKPEEINVAAQRLYKEGARPSQETLNRVDSALRPGVGARRPITESGHPLEAVGRLDAFLSEHVNPGLMTAAYPTSLTDLGNLLIPGAMPRNLLVPAVDAAGSLARLAGRLGIRAGAALGDVVSPDLVGVVSPRLGKGLEIAQKLRDRGTVQNAAPAPVPQRPPRAGSFEEFMGATPERRAEIKAARADYFSSGRRATPEASAPRSAASSGAPPAAMPPSPARSTPPPSAGMRLTPEESQALQSLLAEGYQEADVLQAIASQRPVARPSAPKPATSKPTLNAAEAKEYQRLLGRGLKPEKALELIEQQRAYTQGKGLPTSEQTRQAVKDRNTSGRWD